MLLQKVMEHQTKPKQKPRRVLKPPNIDKNNPWDFVDEEIQGGSTLGGSRGVLFLNETTKIEITFTTEQGTKNKA